MSEKILQLNNLETSFFTHLGEVKAVRGVTYGLNKGGVLGIVGESGSGKSVTSLSIIRLIESPGKIKNGEVIFDGVDLTTLSESEMQELRGSEISMIFQDPMTSLNPVYTIENQMVEVIRRHMKIPKEQALEEAKLITNESKKAKELEDIEKGITRPFNKQEAFDRAINYLTLVGIPEPEERIGQYPHQFSGGMRQRALIAMALSCEPKLLIADEPTTALDVTIQAQILDLLKDIQKNLGTSIIFITHDLGVIAEICQDVVVMYGGMVMEKGTVEEIFYNAQHPYTKGLHQSIPKDIVGQKERLVPIDGSPPDLLSPPKGCPFSPRCEHAMEVCLQEAAPLYKISDTQVSACWLQDPNAPVVKGFTKSGGAE
ncbi:Oligopeptide transport ATP-binding protein OppD [Candidatus Izimaplasma bacterium HR1]|jgi:oligopeptide transport system ATP-binding protein|uniref:ABC transporter ATP-binding protein n=1 Tax=Candidatus Izimoplasma sp. HR1 TaxID=1541959 RepID=UPI0004F62CA7|nr:Oligopeptide transport ATP-binding protein OppD [Candidatus Izimaplasma bacterium HR1]